MTTSLLALFFSTLAIFRLLVTINKFLCSKSNFAAVSVLVPIPMNRHMSFGIFFAHSRPMACFPSKLIFFRCSYSIFSIWDGIIAPPWTRSSCPSEQSLFKSFRIVCRDTLKYSASSSTLTILCWFASLIISGDRKLLTILQCSSINYEKDNLKYHNYQQISFFSVGISSFLHYTEIK